ncbi:hypothetical protein SNE40_018114 [Patella caerulea]|uniref:Uncharacterized protein n=1 Tax=Patella caerulea TaxID=87958 RepID=A0AAN8P6L4_PATCE
MPKTKKKSFTKRQEARKELMKKKRSDHTDDCLQIDLIENPIIKSRNVETNEVQSHNIETENLETNEIENPNVITENLETKVEPSNVITENLETKVEPSNVITENLETNEVENPNIETRNVENPNTETGNLDIHDATIPVIRNENIALNGTETPIPITVIGIVESEIGKDDKKLNDELACIFKNDTKDKYSLNLGRYFEFQERQTKAKRLKNVQVEVAMKKDRKVYWREFKRRKRLSLQFKQKEANIKQTKCLQGRIQDFPKEGACSTH